jgi:hypothetical protein
MIQIQTQIYQVTWAFDTLDEEDFKRSHPEDLWNDLWTDRLVYELEFEELNDMDFQRALNRSQELKGLPNKIVMFGWFDLLQKTELPINNLHWTIISNNFLEVVKQLGFTDYRLIPIRVIDRTPFDNVYSAPIRSYENDVEVQNLRYNDNLFYGFQVLPRIKLATDDSDFFENKIIWREDINPLELPYFFREPRSQSHLLVNQESRDALESAGIRGIRFIEPFGI